MTYGVPYSFTPGTKARANEVNANFIDILGKLEDINSKITETNDQLESKFDQLDTKVDAVNSNINAAKLNTDLSNISAQGQSLFNAKADLSLVDGNWVNHQWTILADVTISASQTMYCSLMDYLPKDGQVYDVLCSVSCKDLSGYANIYTASDYIPSYGQTLRCNKNYASCRFMVPVGPSRWISIFAYPSVTGDCYYTVDVAGYRKAR